MDSIATNLFDMGYLVHGSRVASDKPATEGDVVDCPCGPDFFVELNGWHGSKPHKRYRRR